MKHLPELSQDVPFPQLSVYDVGAVAASSPNTLVLSAGERFDPETIYVLKDALDWSFEEISSRSGMPVGTAKCYAHRGRTSLRRRLAGA